MQRGYAGPWALSLLLLQSSVLLLQAAQQAEVHHIQAAAEGSLWGSRSADVLTAAQLLVQELEEDGAQVHADVREAAAGAGPGLFASQDIKQGDAILSVPVDRGFSALGVSGVLDFLLDFTLDLYNPASPRAHMYATMPPPSRLRHQLNFPQQYLPLLQHKDLEEWMGEGMHSDLKQFCTMHQAALTAANVTYDDVVHALGLLGTRTFSQPTPDGQASIFYALPLFDLAKHDNDCPHFNTFQPCAHDESRDCAFFTAGADVKSGQEICSWYGYLLPDRAFLEYGILSEQPTASSKPRQRGKAKAQKTAAKAAAAGDTSTAADASAGKAAAAAATPKPKRAVRKNKAAEAQLPAVPLFGIDRHDYDPANPLVKLDEEPMPFTGGYTLANITERIAQLQQLHASLKAGDTQAEEVAAKGPAPGDEGGAFLKQVLSWRLQRQQAVVAEVERLERYKTVIEIRTALNKAAARKKR